MENNLTIQLRFLNVGHLYSRPFPPYIYLIFSLKYTVSNDENRMHAAHAANMTCVPPFSPFD